MEHNQKKKGIVLAYIYMSLSSIIGILITPLLISNLGNAEYGLYQLMASFANYLIIVNFGTGTVMTKYVAMYIAKKDSKGKENYIAMCLGITFVLFLIILLLSSVLYFNIDDIFYNSLTASEIILGKKLYVILSFNIAITVFIQAFEGIILAHEKFVVTNILGILKIIVRVILLVILFKLGFKSIAIVSIDFLLTIFSLICVCSYCFTKLKIKIKFHYIDKIILIQSITFSMAIFFQAIINQINVNVDKLILGVMTNTSTVGIYSIAMTIFMIFSSLSTALIAIYLPQATKLVVDGANSEQLTDFIIRPGRFQLIISGTVLGGFLILGRDFLRLWVGEAYLSAWYIAIIIMIPMFLNYINGINVTLLDAMNKRMIRSIILFFIAIINVIMSIIFVKFIGYIGAAIATAIATLIGQVIIMNIYYYKVIKLNVKRMFTEILKGIFPCIAISCVICVPIVLLLKNNIFYFILKGSIYLILVFITLYIFGLNKGEKSELKKLIMKLRSFHK